MRRAYHSIENVLTDEGYIRNDVAKDVFIDDNGNIIDYYYNLKYDSDFIAVGALYDNEKNCYYIEY